MNSDERLKPKETRCALRWRGTGPSAFDAEVDLHSHAIRCRPDNAPISFDCYLLAIEEQDELVLW